MNRRATVLGLDSAGHLVLQTADALGGTAPVPRPYVGSSQTGLHSAPPTGAQVLLLHEAQYKPAAAVSASDALGVLPALAAGETAIFAADGSTLVWAKVSGPHVLYRNAANTLSISVDPATGKVLVVAAGGLWLNGVQVVAP